MLVLEGLMEFMNETTCALRICVCVCVGGGGLLLQIQFYSERVRVIQIFYFTLYQF